MTLAASAHLLATRARAQAMVDEKDPQAAALGYVADAKRVDTKKYPKFAAGQNCASCALYQGKAGDKAGGCPLFAGKQVAVRRLVQRLGQEGVMSRVAALGACS